MKMMEWVENKKEKISKKKYLVLMKNQLTVF
ncbi:hypothetical protein C095_10985 [Fusobacterium necrophorum subsp. funduliforme B35]|uniref:Uncharacterized protein n=1 Tax=Fusobacterium necrophorum subsp. funduliforme B35 TaxID=1226633 RepID=A0A0B4EMT7_9FUSO|nr:hypothetical protein C095_10985 [Fusobacterium necrophorum subsp. funduliforme B35]